MLEVYNDATPNGLKVSIALEELALQYNIHRIFLGGAQVTPEFTKLNPNQKIPVLVDSDEDIVLTESGAILVAITGNATTAATDIIFNFLEINAMN